MNTIEALNSIINKSETVEYINAVWKIIGAEYEGFKNSSTFEDRMAREELSFHEDVKLLGYLCLMIDGLKGDIVEIGLWKGKTLAFLSRIANSSKNIIGIDPCLLRNQKNELNYYNKNIFPNSIILEGYSEYLITKVMEISKSIALLHIDGGHDKKNVFLDFLLYSPLIVSGGFIVFDDYHDSEFSPQVGIAVDMLRVGGFFNDYLIIGTVDKYRNSYVLRKK